MCDKTEFASKQHKQLKRFGKKWVKPIISVGRCSIGILKSVWMRRRACNQWHHLLLYIKEITTNMTASKLQQAYRFFVCLLIKCFALKNHTKSRGRKLRFWPFSNCPNSVVFFDKFKLGVTGCFFELVPPLKVRSTKKLIQARLGVSRYLGPRFQADLRQRRYT